MRLPLCLAAVALTGLFAISPALAAPPAWPQAKSDLPADPAVRFGVLANGMRYAVMRNATPAGQTSLRLRIGSGSLEESDAQQGLAHVLEHMAFKGSTHVPAGQMIPLLQRNGLAFGADTNAETGWTQTVYMLDLPRSDAALMSTGLMLMRETAGELSLDEGALSTERGVVLSEERLRDTPEFRAQKAQIDLLAHGQRAVSRFPIGLVDVVQDAPVSLVRDFYRANYRPDRATLIAVGDFDPAGMEAEIKEKFSNWAPVGPGTAEPDLGQVEKRGLTLKVVTLPGAATQAQIAWARPYDDGLDTAAKRLRDSREALALAVLNRRLARRAQDANPPFLTADAAFQNLLHSDEVAVVEATSAPGAWRPALAAVDEEVRRLVAFGVSKEELAREIADMRAALVGAVAGANARPTTDLAQGLVDAVDEDNVPTSPAEDLALFDKAAAGLTPADIDAAARGVFAGAGPLVELTTPTPIAGGEGVLAAAYAKADAAPLNAPTAQAAIAWPYQHFGPAGAVVERHDIDGVGAVAVRFANGVGLIVKPTKFRDNQVLVAASVGGGRASLPMSRPAAAWAASAVVDGGFKALSAEDAHRALAGRIYDAQFAIGDRAFEFRGATQPSDLSTQLQVLAAYVTEPGFRPEIFEQARAAWLAALPQMTATPDGVLGRDFSALLHDSDPRWAFPDQAQLESARPADLKALLEEPLTRGPLEVTVVGDITVEAAIAEVAKTFGALPPRPAFAPPSAEALKVRFPAPTAAPLTRADAGRADQAIAVIAWPTGDFFTSTARARAAMLAGEVLGNRILDRVRIAQGATYSPETTVALSETFPGYGVAYAMVEMPPAKIPSFYQDVAAITADMRVNLVTPDELARARNPRMATITKAQLTNEYWVGRLADALADPRELDLIRTTLPDYAKVTAEDIRKVADEWLVDGAAWKLVISNPKVGG